MMDATRTLYFEIRILFRPDYLMGEFFPLSDASTSFMLQEKAQDATDATMSLLWRKKEGVYALLGNLVGM